MAVSQRKRRINLTLTKEAYNLLEEIAVDNKRTKSEIIEMCFWLVITSKLDAENKEEKKCN